MTNAPHTLPPRTWLTMASNLLRMPAMVMPHRAAYKNAPPVQAGQALASSGSAGATACLAGTKLSTK